MAVMIEDYSESLTLFNLAIGFPVLVRLEAF